MFAKLMQHFAVNLGPPLGKDVFEKEE